MGKYKYRESSYAYEDTIGFESIRSMIEDEFSSNSKTDDQQSKDIAAESTTRQTADEQFEERISALEQASGGSDSEIAESFNEFTGTTYPADKEALEAKDAELEASIAEKADAADVEAVQSAIDTLNGDGEGSVKKTAEDAAVAEVAKVVAEAPEDFDTLKEVADYIASDKTKAAEIETKLADHDSAIESLEAKDEELEAAIAEKADASALDAKADASMVEAALDEKADKADLDAKADSADVEAETARATAEEARIEAKVDAKADNAALEAEVTRALAKEGELTSAIAEKASNADLDAEKSRAEAAEQALEAKVDEKADASTVADELTELKSKDTELEAKDAAQDEEIAKKVEWTESTPGRNHIVLKNHDSLLGTATDGTTYNVAMVSKWDVADFGTTHLHLNLNTSDAVTINDNKVVATEDVVDEKIATIQIPSVEGLAAESAVTAEAEARVAADEALQDAIDAIEIPSIEGLAAESAVTAEEEARVAGDEALQESINEVDAKVEAIVIPDVSGFATESAMTAADEALQTNIDAVDAKVDAIVIPDVSGFATNAALAEVVTNMSAVNEAQDASILAKADKTELEGLASEEYVDEQIEKVVGTAPENFDTLEEFADALADLKVVDVPAVPGEHYTQEEIDEAQPGDDAYGKTTDDWKVEPVEEVSHNMTIGEFVETVDEKPQIEALTRKYEALLTILNLTDADVNSVMLNEELIESNNVVFDEGPVNNIVVPETTKSKSITAELDPDTDLTLTSRYSVTINNTSEETTNLNVTAPAVSGYNAATITVNDGEFDTITLTDASLTVNTGASVQNVVITQETTKNLTINAMFAEGATITSESSAAITLTNKNPEGEEVSVVLDAPGATVTMSGGKWVNVEAAVSPDTLIINSNAHIENLTVTQGNVLVKVARQSDIESVVKNYTLAPGSSIDYLHDEISASNVSNLATTGTHTLVEDITKSGRFAPGIFASDNMVWNLNGHNITFTNTQGYANFLLRGSLQLEINGEGNVVNSAGDYGFWAAAEGVKVVVNGGHFEAATHVLYAEKGTIEVNGGSFKLTNPDECDKDVNGNFKFLLNCKDENYAAGTAKIIVRGGKFYGFNPAVTYGEPSGPVSYVAPGYHVVESTEDGMKVFEVVADE